MMVHKEFSLRDAQKPFPYAVRPQTDLKKSKQQSCLPVSNFESIFDGWL